MTRRRYPLAHTLCLLVTFCVLLPVSAFAQGFPVPSPNAPMFGFPFAQGSTANPFVNVSFTGQALGPDNCTTAPAYSLTSAPTNGWGGTATSICGVVGGVATLTGTATTWTSTVPYVGTTADFSGNVAIGNYVGTDTDATAGIMVNSTWRWRVGTEAENYRIVANGQFDIGDSAEPGNNSPVNIYAETQFVGRVGGTASATVFNFGTPGTGLYGDTDEINISTVTTNWARFDGSANTAFIIGSGHSLAFGATVGAPDWFIGWSSASVAAMGSGDILQTAGSGEFRAATASSAFRANGAGASFRLSNDAFVINTAPTVSNGCTAEAMTWNNGTAAFEADMGNTCAGISTVVFTLPTIANKYQCKATNLTSPATMYMDPTAWTTTTVTFTNFSRTTGLATAFTDGDDVLVSCLGG